MKVVSVNHGALQELAGHEITIEGIAYASQPDRTENINSLPVAIVASDAIITVEDDGIYKSLNIIPLAQVARIKLRMKPAPAPKK